MRARPVFAAVVLALVACTRVTTIRSVPSPTPGGGSGHLRAGLARVDITPPPGAGLFGYATEGARSQGHRMRLYARAIVLEDPAGERIAFVLADLGAISALLHREVAERVHGRTGIGADRLIVSATHSHSAPGHFFGTPAYDEQGSAVEGHDPWYTEALADGLASAVLQAFAALRPARAAWGFAPMWRQTRVRADTAAQRNPKRFVHPAAASAAIPDDPRYRFIDPQLSMLRIDVQSGDRFEPAGSFTIFPVHGTLNPGANQLMDGDLHSIVMRNLEHTIGAGARGPGLPPATVHLFANGAEGDIVANFSTKSRCPAPAPRVKFWPTGPRRPVPPDAFLPVAEPPFPECLQIARANAVEIGDSMAAAAAALYARLAEGVQRPEAGQLRIARNFAVLSTSAGGLAERLCKPQAGPATIGGTEGGFSRFLNLALFRAVLQVDTTPSPPVPLPPRDACRGNKKNIGWFEASVGGTRPYPNEVQLTVVRIGDVVIGTVPGEATTNAGARMRRAMAADSTAPFATIYEKNLILGLANGYVHYIATPYEYTAQLYEGAATLYGPYTAEIIATQLGRLARALPPPGGQSPAVEIPPVMTVMRIERVIVPPTGAVPAAIQRRLSTCWRGDTLVARWNDHPPGELDPAAGALLHIERQASAGSEIVTWDDDPFLEVWHLHGQKREAVWEARYAPERWQSGEHRVVLRERGPLSAVPGEWLVRGARACAQ